MRSVLCVPENIGLRALDLLVNMGTNQVHEKKMRYRERDISIDMKGYSVLYLVDFDETINILCCLRFYSDI